MAPVEHRAFDRELWESEILPLAGGDPSRIEIRDATTVVIHNPGWRAPKRR